MLGVLLLIVLGIIVFVFMMYGLGIILGGGATVSWGIFKFFQRIFIAYVCLFKGCRYKDFLSSEVKDEGEILYRCDRCNVVYHKNKKGKYKPWRKFYYAMKSADDCKNEKS